MDELIHAVAAFAGSSFAHYMTGRTVGRDLRRLRAWCADLALRVGYPAPPKFEDHPR